VNAWTLAAKDLLVYGRDRTGLLLGLGLPIVLALIFGTAMGAIGGEDGTPRVRLALEDRDGSDASRELVAALDAADAIRVRLVEPAAADADPDESARGRVATGNAPAGLLIRKGFGASLGEDAGPRLRLYRDPSRHVEQQILGGALLPVFFETFGDTLGKRLVTGSLGELGFPAGGLDAARGLVGTAWDRLSAIAAENATDGSEETAAEEVDAAVFDFASGVLGAVGLETEDLAGGSDAKEAQRIGQQAHAVAGIAVMMLLFGLVACGSTLREEEDQGTLDRLRLAGSVTSILGGKFLFTWIIGIAQLVILFLVGALVFDVPFFRDPGALFLLSATTVAAATGFGILFAATCESRKQVEGVSTLVILAMSAAGGSWFPLFITPAWFQTLGHFTLNAWAMDGYHALFLYDRGLAGILTDVGVLAAIAAGTSLAAVWLWERRLAV